MVICGCSLRRQLMVVDSHQCDLLNTWPTLKTSDCNLPPQGSHEGMTSQSASTCGKWRECLDKRNVTSKKQENHSYCKRSSRLTSRGTVFDRFLQVIGEWIGRKVHQLKFHVVQHAQNQMSIDIIKLLSLYICRVMGKKLQQTVQLWKWVHKILLYLPQILCLFGDRCGLTISHPI